MASNNTVKVKIVGELDKSFQNALKLTQAGLKGLGKVGAFGLKAAGAGVVAATAGVAALGKAAVKTGSEFESSMSQVAATMLIDKTTQEGAASFQTLEDAARECGRSTAFSASEAAEGLNYLALAGYSADEAAMALPTVLRIAGAGAMELADASDMVTDSMSALGIAATQENLETFGDRLAKTASKSNTSVSELGEAMIKVGGTAKGLAGGVVEASTALGILADNGIKGAEGGTHLRNMIMSLQNPRNKKAGELMKNLNISAYDEATGKMKSLGDTFADLNEKLTGNTAAENNTILSSIFKQTDLAAAKAMMAATANSVESLSSVMDASLVESGQSLESLGIDLQSLADSFDTTMSAEAFAKQMNDEFGMSADNAGVLFNGLNSLVGDGKTRFEGLSEAIADSEDAAKDMYDIQLDNLEGDVSKLKSAFDDLKISIYKDLGGPVRAVTQLGTQMITNIRDAYAKGGMSAAVAQLGTEAANAVTLIAQNGPALINVGIQLIQNLVAGIQQNLPAIASGAVNIVMTFANGVFQVAPTLLVTGAQAVLMFAQGIVANIPSLITAGVNAVASFISGIVPMIPQIFQLGIQAVLNLVNGIVDNRGTLVSSAAELIGGLVSGLIQSIPQLLLAVPQIVGALVGGIFSTDWIQVGKDILGGLWKGLTGGGGDDAGKGQAVGANIATNYAAGIQANQYQVQGALNGMLTSVDTSGMAAAGTEAGTAFTTSFSESLSMDAASAGTAITSLAEAASTSAAELGTIGTESGTLMTDNLTAAIDTGGVNAVASVDATANSIKSTIDAVNLQPSGANMMQGLITGMESKRAQVMAKAKSIAEAASKAVNEALDVHSPSRVMMQTGEYVGEGLAIGMEGQQSDIKAAAETMSAPVSGGIGGILKDTLATVTGSRKTTNNTQNASSTFNFSPTYVLEGGGSDKESIVEANKMSQNEFARMMEDYMHRNARVSYA